MPRRSEAAGQGTLILWYSLLFTLSGVPAIKRLWGGKGNLDDVMQIGGVWLLALVHSQYFSTVE